MNRSWLIMRWALPPLIHLFIMECTAFCIGQVQGGSSAAAVLAGAACSLAVLYFLGRFDRRVCGGGDGTRARGFPAGYCAAAFGAGMVFSLGGSRLMEAAGLFARFSNAPQEGLLGSPLPLLIAGPGLLVPLCEELIYRQMCQQWLKAIIPGPAAVCAAALLFAACHGNMLQFIYALPMGLLLGALRESKAGLPGAVCFHAGANLAAIAAARLL